MLTKSAAKAFFLGGTALCSLAFILLTLDTLEQFPERSNQDQMSESVVRGHHIWNQNNCMGCHTLMGEGAYYAPELTKVSERRTEAWLRTFLVDPQAMYPGRRKMVKYDFFDAAIVGEEEANKNLTDILNFFEWVGEIDMNGFPPEHDMAVAMPTFSFDDSNPAPEYYTQICAGCHSIGGVGGAVGPALDGVGSKYDSEYMTKWIADPQGVKPGTTMPKLNVAKDDLDAIVAYLSELKE
ncbi:MAG: cytochrome c [Planctomycetes bacterium]|nr:cytochrome c [Planctomycetota bacterium]